MFCFTAFVVVQGQPLMTVETLSFLLVCAPTACSFVKTIVPCAQHSWSLSAAYYEPTQQAEPATSKDNKAQQRSLRDGSFEKSNATRRLAIEGACKGALAYRSPTLTFASETKDIDETVHDKSTQSHIRSSPLRTRKYCKHGDHRVRACVCVCVCGRPLNRFGPSPFPCSTQGPVAP